LAVRISKINSVHEGGIPYRAVPADPQVVRTGGRNSKGRSQQSAVRIQASESRIQERRCFGVSAHWRVGDENPGSILSSWILNSGF
jgi:hypothetical protein